MIGRRLFVCSAVLLGCVPQSPLGHEYRAGLHLHCGLNLPVYLAVGDTFRLYAARIQASSQGLTCLDSMVPGHAWQSSAPQLVSINTAGLARALRPGRAQITALTQYGPAGGQCVVLPAFARFGFGHDSVVAPLSVYTRLSVDPQDSAGHSIDAWAQYHWIGGDSVALGTLISSGSPVVEIRPSRAGRAFLVGRVGIHTDTVLVVARP